MMVCQVVSGVRNPNISSKYNAFLNIIINVVILSSGKLNTATEH